MLLRICAAPDCERTSWVKSNGRYAKWCHGHQKRLGRRGAVGDAPIRTQGLDYMTADGYWVRVDPQHPLRRADNTVLVHRVVLYEKIGPGAHPCHWCQVQVAWEVPYPAGLVTDHLDSVRTNNDPANLVPSCTECNAHRGKPKSSRFPPARSQAVLIA